MNLPSYGYLPHRDRGRYYRYGPRLTYHMRPFARCSCHRDSGEAWFKSLLALREKNIVLAMRLIGCLLPSDQPRMTRKIELTASRELLREG